MDSANVFKLIRPQGSTMATAPERAASELHASSFDVAALVRTASWGVGAAAALFLAVLAGVSDSGAPRVAAAVSTLSGQPENTATVAIPATPPVVVVQPQLALETRRLHEQVRLLAADRDRLVQRLGVLERKLEDMTGSIRRQQASAKVTPSAEPPPPPATVLAAPWPAIPMTPTEPSPWSDPPQAEIPQAETPPETTASLPPGTPLPPPRPPFAEVQQAGPTAATPAANPPSPRQAAVAPRAGPPAGRTAYGVDLGGGISVDRLRLLWNALRTSEARLLQGLRPIAQTRETKRGGRPDVRLVAGPLPSADDAARLCAAILNAGRYCEPAVYHGQRLSAR